MFAGESLLVTPCLLTRIREFIHTQHCNTTRDQRPNVVLRWWVRINSRIHGSKQMVTKLSHAETMFVTSSNVSAALKPQLSLLSCFNHRINTVLLGRIAASGKVDGGRDRHCDVINDALFSLYLILMTSNVKYVSIVNGYYSQSEARVSTVHGINAYISTIVIYKTVCKWI